MIREGLALRLYAEQVPDLSRLGAGYDGFPVDVERTDTLAGNVYRYSGLFDTDTSTLDSTERQVVSDIGFMFVALGTAFDSIGDRDRSLENLERAVHLMPDNSGLEGYVSNLRSSPRGSVTSEP